jgi:hypothetical protein
VVTVSATISVPTSQPWLRRLLSGRPHQSIGTEGDPYLQRWFLIPHNGFVNLYLHKFCHSDDDRALHDHPWPFLSLIVAGQYREVTETTTVIRRRWSIAARRAHHRHRVELAGEPTPVPVWTLVLTGPRRRTWGFWCPQDSGTAADARFVPWQQFDAGGCGEPAPHRAETNAAGHRGLFPSAQQR